MRETVQIKWMIVAFQDQVNETFSNKVNKDLLPAINFKVKFPILAVGNQITLSSITKILRLDLSIRRWSPITVETHS